MEFEHFYLPIYLVLKKTLKFYNHSIWYLNQSFIIKSINKYTVLTFSPKKVLYLILKYK